MRILVLSDNHFVKLDELDFSKYNYVIHCGDYGDVSNVDAPNIIYVRGNCDRFGPKNRIVEVFGKKVLVTHGDLENVKYTCQTLLYKALEMKVDVVCFGHTHSLTYFIEEGILFINPGSYPFSYIEIEDNNIYLFSCGKKRKIEYKW